MTSLNLRAGLALALLPLCFGCASMPTPSIPFITTNSKIEAQMAVARLQEQQGDLASAKGVYEGVLKKRPKHAEAHQRLAVIAVRQGKTDLAEEHFNKARELDPKNYKLLNDLGYFYYLENRLTEAEEVLREVVDEDPLNPRALNNLGLVLGFQNRTDEAMEAFRRVGTDAEAHANIAFVYAHLGDLDRAQAHYSQALTHNPGMKPAAQALLEIARRAPRPRVPSNQPGPFNPANSQTHLAAQPSGPLPTSGFVPEQMPHQPMPQFQPDQPPHGPRPQAWNQTSAVQPAGHSAAIGATAPFLPHPPTGQTAHYEEPLNQTSFAAPIPTAIDPRRLPTPQAAMFDPGTNAPIQPPQPSYGDQLPSGPRGEPGPR